MSSSFKAVSASWKTTRTECQARPGSAALAEVRAGISRHEGASRGLLARRRHRRRVCGAQAGYKVFARKCPEHFHHTPTIYTLRYILVQTAP